MASRRIFMPRGCTQHYKNSAGFTLIEILVVIGLLAVISSFTMIESMQSFHSSSLRDERDSLVATLYKARSQALNNVCLGTASFCSDGRPHGVHLEPSTGKYTFFQGATYATRDTAIDQTFTPSYAITFISPSFTDVVFSQLTGDVAVDPPGVWTITIQDPTTKIETITLNAEGQILWSN